MLMLVKKGDRFIKHLQTQTNSTIVSEGNKESEPSTCNSNNRHNILGNLFCEDIVASDNKGNVSLVMDQAQVGILEKSWRSQAPDKLSAYKDEYKLCFPVHESAMNFLQVPSLDELLEPMMRSAHGARAVKSWDSHRQLFTQPFKQIEKLSFQGQLAARMNIISVLYMQQMMGTLLEKLGKAQFVADKKKESYCQVAKDMFAMSTKALDQSGCTGAFFHLVRRKAAAQDSGLVTLNEIKDKTQYLPLTGEGVFGEALNNCLEKCKEQKEQRNDLLPELARDRKRKTDYGISKENWHTGNKNPKYNAGDRSVGNANNSRNFPSARSYGANNRSSNNGKQKDTNKRVQQEGQQETQDWSDWIPRKYDS